MNWKAAALEATGVFIVMLPVSLLLVWWLG